MIRARPTLIRPSHACPKFVPRDFGHVDRRTAVGGHVVIGAPMYNFSIPAPLKAWIDQIVRMGKTFSVGANGPQGLLGRKNVVVITSVEARTTRALR